MTLCNRCGDTGSVVSPGPGDYGVSFESEHCTSCRYGRALIAHDAAEWEVYEAHREIEASGCSASHPPHSAASEQDKASEEGTA